MRREDSDGAWLLEIFSYLRIVSVAALVGLVFLEDYFMGILEFIVICVVLGLVVWLVNTYLPLPAPIKTIILVAVIIVIVVILFRAMGIFDGMDYRIPRVR